MHDQIQFEHEIRDKRISPEQKQAWTDGLLASLPDSVAYQRKCTKEARLAEQEILLQLVSDWEKQQKAVQDKSTN